MIKTKKNPNKWEIGDAFYYQINNYNEELDGKYIIFIKSDTCCGVPLFRIKVTPNSELPQTQTELENLKYARVGTRIWEKRFFPLKGNVSIEELINERNNTKFFPDENGILYIYQVSIRIKNSRSIPKDWNYLGNFDLSIPSDEYIPFQKLDIWGFIWDYGKDHLFHRYLRYNSKSKDYIDLAKKQREQEQKNIRTIISHLNKKQDNVDKIMDIITTIK